MVVGEGNLDLFQFLLELKARLSIERLCCYVDGSYARRFKRWERFYDSVVFVIAGTFVV